MILRKQWRERREAYECSVAEIEQSKKQKQVENQHEEERTLVMSDHAQVFDKYSTLQQSLLNEVMQPYSESSLSLSFVQKCGSVTVFVEGTNNSVLNIASRALYYSIVQ